MTAQKQISLCMVTYNDEKYISDCLAELKDYVDEIIIADIGSSDKTVELAKQAGADIYPFDWNKSFSHARNYCMDRAGGRWILFLQADESISAAQLKDLTALLKNPNYEGYLFYYDNSINERGISSPNNRLRLIRNRKEYRYLYRAYERLPDEQISSIQNTCIKIGRRGCEPSWDADMRIRLLDADIAEHPDDHYINYMYGIRLFNEGRHEESIDYFKKACHNLNTDYVFAPHLYKCLGWSLLYLKRYDEALEILNSGIGSFPLYTDLLVLRGEIYHQLGLYSEGIQDLKLCLNTMQQSVHMVPRPETNAAIVWEMLGTILTQLVNYRQALMCFQQAYSLNYKNTELLSEICRLVIEEDMPEVLTAMLKIPMEQKMTDQIMILAEAYFTLGKYEETLDCIGLLKRFGVPDPLTSMEYICRMILGKYPPYTDSDGDCFLLQRIQCLWLRDKMSEAESLLQEIDTATGINPSVKDLYRYIQKVFSGQAQPFDPLTPDAYTEIRSFHNTLLRTGKVEKAEALLPLLLNVQNQDHLISLGLTWTRYNQFDVLQRIINAIVEADKRSECKYRILKKLLDYGHVETAEKWLQVDAQQASEEMQLAIWSARQIKKMEEIIRNIYSIEAINTPRKQQEIQPLVHLFGTIHERFGMESNEKEMSCTKIHEQFGVYFQKRQKKIEALSAYLRVLQWDPLNEGATQKICAFYNEDSALFDKFLQDIPWPMEGGLFYEKEEFADYIRGLVCFRNEQYEQAYTFFSSVDTTETRCFPPLAYIMVILSLWDKDVEAEALLKDRDDSSEILDSFYKIYRNYIMHKLEEGLTQYPYNGLLLGQKESVQNRAMYCTV